jgi:hypothetical protein
MDNLDRALSDHIEGGSPSFVTPNHFVQSSPQRFEIKRASPTNRYGFVINRRPFGNHPGAEPQLFLGQGQRCGLAARSRSDCVSINFIVKKVTAQVLLEQFTLGF